MSTRFYRLSLLLPLAAPALAILIDQLLTAAGYTQTWFDGVAVVLVGSVLVAGIPYLLFATAMLLLLRHAPESAWRRALLRAPAIFSIVVGAAVLAVGFANADGPSLLAALTWGGVAIALGYAYVAAVFAAEVFLRPILGIDGGD
jgi:hypothetical protein